VGSISTAVLSDVAEYYSLLMIAARCHDSETDESASRSGQFNVSVSQLGV